MSKHQKYSWLASITAIAAGICNYLVIAGKVDGLLLIVLLILGIIISMVAIALIVSVFTKSPDKTVRKIIDALFDLTFLYP